MGRLIKNFIYIGVIIFSCSCITRKDILELSNLIETTHQIVLYNDNLIRIEKPNIDGECCKKIQLLNKKLEIIDEIDCLEPYPSVSIENDSIIVTYYIYESEEKLFEGGYAHFKNKFSTIGNYELYYMIQHIHGSMLGNNVSVDSIHYNGSSVLVYNNNNLIDKKKLEEIFFMTDYFYSIDFHDGIREQRNYKPVSVELYQDFMLSLINQ